MLNDSATSFTSLKVMTQSKTCPACEVVINEDDQVLFSYGPPGSRAKLYARVCQYAKKPGCINRDEQKIGDIQECDYYN